jgi:hypothetical protein
MALRIALSGFVVLVVAMGIGRFAFTPQVPLMIADGQLTLTSAGLVAAMNYLGYLVGPGMPCERIVSLSCDSGWDYWRGCADVAVGRCG